jgi:toxin ParE1/3/4
MERALRFMQGYKLSVQADRDIQEILRFTLDRWGADQLSVYASKLNAALSRLINLPSMGTLRDDIIPGYYRYQVGQHYIFYRIGGEYLEIARILHVRREVTPDLFKGLRFYQ